MTPTSKLNNTGKRDSSQETVPFSFFRDKLCMKGLLIMTILDFK